MTFNSISGHAIAVDNKEKVIYQVDLRDNYMVKDLITEHIGNVTGLSFGKLTFICSTFNMRKSFP